MSFSPSSGVPIVKPQRGPRGSKYPFATMEVDDWFFVPQKSNETFTSYVSYWGKKLDRKFRTRTCWARLIKKVWKLCEEGDNGATKGVGVWRVE